MAPLRIQCFNSATQITKNGPRLLASFSTSQKLRAAPPRSSSTEDLLSTLSAFESKNVSSPLVSRAFEPIRLPRQHQPTPGNDKASKNISRLIADSNAAKTRRQDILAQKGSRTGPDYESKILGQDLSRQIGRRWRAGDVYAPHDLSEVEMSKWKKRSQPDFDVFDVCDFNPLDHYRNFSIMSEYMTPMGRIKHSHETGLRPVNQRKIARAIRRSIGMGMMPSVHRHPEILYKQATRSGEQIWATNPIGMRAP